MGSGASAEQRSRVECATPAEFVAILQDVSRNTREEDFSEQRRQLLLQALKIQEVNKPPSPVGIDVNPEQDEAATASVLAEARQEAQAPEAPAPEVASKVIEDVQEPTYSLKDPNAFAQFLETANIRLVRAKYLVELLRAKRPLLRRQELESEAFVADVANGWVQTALVSHQEVQSWGAGSLGAIICSVSHAWETREHPDPCCYQLQHIVNRVGLYEAAFDAEAWVFYDYASLFQFQRFSSQEEQSFRAAMQNMHLMYAHECTLTLRIESLTPDDVWEGMKSNETELIPVYDIEQKCVVPKPLKLLVENRAKYLDRGWCMAEVEWSSLRSVNAQHQHIDKVNDSESEDLNGRVPLTPESFRVKMEKAEFTHRSDAGSVIHLQGKIFFEKVTACEELVLESVPAEQILVLARALPLYGKLRSLTLRNFRCGQEEAEAFGKALTFRAVEMLKVDNQSHKQDTCFLVKAVAEALKANESLNKSLAHIDLKGNRIDAEGTKAFLEALKYTKSVTHIDLRMNQFDDDGAKALAEALKSNQLVTYVDLGGMDVLVTRMTVFCPSNIGVEGAKAVAESLKDNKSIKYINLANNKIGSEGAEALAKALTSNTSVTHMNLSKNNIGAEGIKAFEEALEFNTSLAYMELSWNTVGKRGMQALEEALKRNEPTTTDLEDRSGKQRMPERTGFFARTRIEALVEALKANTSVTKITFPTNDGGQWNPMGPDKVKALAEALKVNTSLTHIDLSNNNLQLQGAKAFAEALKVNTSLISLILQQSSIGPKGAQALAEAFKVNTSATDIDLRNNNIGPEGMQALAEAFKVNTSVTDLNVGNTNIGPEGMQALAEALKINTSVSSIILCQKIGPDTAQVGPPNWWLGPSEAMLPAFEALAEALKINKSLSYIDLSQSALGPAGAQALAEGLKINTSVTNINLYSNAIGPEGAKALAEALKVNTSVIKITLSTNNTSQNNPIGPEGAKALAEALKVNTSVEIISVGANAIGPEGAQALAEALKINNSVTDINVGNNAIGPEGAQALAEALKINTSVMKIVLNSNKIGPEGAQALAEALKINTSVTDISLISNKVGPEGAQALQSVIDEKDNVDFDMRW